MIETLAIHAGPDVEVVVSGDIISVPNSNSGSRMNAHRVFDFLERHMTIGFMERLSRLVVYWTLQNCDDSGELTRLLSESKFRYLTVKP